MNTNIVQIVTDLVAALSYVVGDAVEAYMAGDPSKLDKVQDILPTSERLKSEEVLILEREKTRRALEG